MQRYILFSSRISVPSLLFGGGHGAHGEVIPNDPFADPKGIPRDYATTRVLSIVKEHPDIDAGIDVTSTAHFSRDLGLDSLQSTELVAMIEDSFRIRFDEDEALKIESVSDAIEAVVRNPHCEIDLTPH